MLEMKLYVLGWLFFAVEREILAVLRLKGTENKQLNITCSHAWATTNVKYFCRLECGDKDVLIRSIGVGKTAKKGRYSLNDRGLQFTVSIERLVKSDEGQYWCGVERNGIDTYQEVILKVLDAPQVTAAPQTKTGLKEFGPGKTALENKARHNYIPMCVCGFLMILVLSLALHYNQIKTCRVLTDCLSESTSHTPPGDTGHDTIDKITPGDRNSNATDPVYENLEPRINQSDPVYQTLHNKATQLDSTYETLVRSKEQIRATRGGKSDLCG